MMRSFIVMGMFAASLAQAGWGDFEEVRELNVDASAADTLKIHAGAGSLSVRGVDGLQQVDVEARIQVDEMSASEATALIEKHLVLTLEKSGGEAVLTAKFKNGIWATGSGESVALVVEVPTGMAPNIDDGSGSITVSDVGEDLIIEDDGSGGLSFENVRGAVEQDT